MAEPTSSIGTRMARGAAWMVVLQSADRILGFVSMLILARLLVPADFGLVALGMAVVGSLAAFSEFGFDLALIQNQTAERRHYDTAWTLSVLRGFLLAGLLLLLAQPAATIFDDERLVALVSTLAIIPFLQGFANVGIVEFRKQLDFKKEFLYRFSSRLGGVITTVSLAFFWRDYWALVVGQLVAQGLRLFLSYGCHSYRPRLSLAAWRDLFNFSKWLFLNAIVHFASNRATTFVVGAFMTPTLVGLITLSQEITGLGWQVLVAPIKRTFFPGFAKLSHDLAALRKVLLNAYGLTVLSALPLTVGIGMTAELFVPLALGVNWLETIPLIEVLVYAALALALEGPARPVLLALNRPAIVTSLSMINAAILIPALIGGTWWAGVFGAAWALVAASFIMMIVRTYILQHFLRVSLASLMSRVWRALASCGVMALAVWGLKQTIASPAAASITEQMLNFALVVAAGALVYGLGLLFFWRLSRCPADSAEGIVLALLQKKLARTHQQPSGKITSGGKAGP